MPPPRPGGWRPRAPVSATTVSSLFVSIASPRNRRDEGWNARRGPNQLSAVGVCVLGGGEARPPGRPARRERKAEKRELSPAQREECTAQQTDKKKERRTDLLRAGKGSLHWPQSTEAWWKSCRRYLRNRQSFLPSEGAAGYRKDGKVRTRADGYFATNQSQDMV